MDRTSEVIGMTSQEALDFLDSLYKYVTRIVRDKSIVHMWMEKGEVQRVNLTLVNGKVTEIEREKAEPSSMI